MLRAGTSVVLRAHGSATSKVVFGASKSAVTVAGRTAAPAACASSTGRLPQGVRWYTYKSNFPDVTIPEMPFTEYALGRCDEFGDKKAFVDALTGESITYGDLPRRVHAAARALEATGFGRGDVLCLHLPNVVEYMVGYHAVATLGATTTTSNPLYTPSELAHQLTDSGAKMIVTLPPFKDIVEAAVKEAGGSITIQYLGEPDCVLSAPITEDTPAATTVDGVNPKEQLLVLPYSSGTTGLPKGVCLTHHSVTANVAQITQCKDLSLDFQESDRVLNLLPNFHIYGQVVVANAALRCGSELVTLPRFEPDMFLQTLQDYKVTFAPLVPPLVLFLAKHPMVNNYDLSSLRMIFSGAAPLDAELEAALVARFPHIVTRQGYGATEMSPVSHMAPVSGDTVGSVGYAIPNTECRIVDLETGEALPPGKENRGELLVRGPNLMRGYLNNDAATQGSFTDDGFLMTGDIASATEDGHFYIVDRLKELIKCKGFQVAPAELEGIIHEHPQVADVAVIGIADDRAGEVPKAFVVKADAKLNAQQLSDFLSTKVADFKQISAEHIEFIDEIPKSASGKILRRMLKE